VILLQPLTAAPSAGRWVTGRTSHFTLISNADERSVERLASNLERFVAVTARLFGADAVPGAPATVLAFRDEGSFRPFKPLYRGRPGNISGFFEHSHDETIIALDISAARISHPFAVVFHEYTHLLTSEAGRNWPAWVREGLAEFYSTFLVQGDVVTLGMPVADHVRLLRDGVLLPLPQLLVVDAESPIYNEGHRQSLFYAQAWALIHYLSLRQEPGRPFQLRRFLQALADGRPTDKAFQDTIGQAYPKLEAELRAYVASRVYPVISVRMEAPRAAERFTVTALSPADTDVQLGKLLLHVNRLDDAEVLFERARRLDATSPGPHEALGFLALRRGQVAAALEHLAEAFRRDSRSHLAHYAYADALSRQRPDGRFSPDQARAILGSARAAAAFEPRFLPARHLMARIYMTLPGEADVAEGARAMAEARAIFPADSRIALTLGNLQFQQRDYDAATASLRAAAASTDLTLKTQAEYLLAQIAEASGRSWAPETSSPEYGR
jgi:tetratricopeptide (TPR) repeat protein